MTLKYNDEQRNSILELYNTFDWQWMKRLEYINDNLWIQIHSIDSLRTLIKNIRKSKWINPWNWQEYSSKFNEVLEETGFDKHDWNHWWLKVDWASIHIKNETKFDQEAFIDKMLEDIRNHSINYKKINYPKIKDSHLLIIDPADHHFWKYASPDETDNNYDLDIAKQRFEDWIDWLLEKSKWFKKDKILFVIWNDILHIDSLKRTTTWWTPQDTDWMWFEAFNVAKMCIIEAIEKLQKIAPVTIVHNQSNHDYMSWWFLAQTIQAWFHKNPNLTWDISTKDRKYYMYWETLISLAHWHGAKEKDIWMLMALEAPKMWATAKFRYVYLHHFHHKIAKDLLWLTAEYMRSWSWTDSWHNTNWYMSNPAMDCFIHSKENGQIARLTHYFK